MVSPAQVMVWAVAGGSAPGAQGVGRNWKKRISMMRTTTPTTTAMKWDRRSSKRGIRSWLFSLRCEASDGRLMVLTEFPLIEHLCLMGTNETWACGWAVPELEHRRPRSRCQRMCLDQTSCATLSRRVHRIY